MQLSNRQLRLIDRWQRDLPLVPAPFARIAADLGVSEPTLLGMLAELRRQGVLSRVGAVVAPNTVGASTLAAMAVAEDRLDELAEIVSGEPGVNHNYEREHRFNLWFVVTGWDRAAVVRTLRRIEERTGLPVLDLPLETAYHIDLGFPLTGDRPGARRTTPAPCGAPVRVEVECTDRTLLAAIEDGLPIVSRPFAAVGEWTGASEEAVIARLRRLTAAGIIKRLGLVVRHRELGFRANAMVVWDIPNRDVDRTGTLFAGYPFVTLSYRRPRRQPDWPYNLFCMIHGRERAVVLDQVAMLERAARGVARGMDVLFSVRRFKQRGAHLSAA